MIKTLFARGCCVGAVLAGGVAVGHNTLAAGLPETLPRNLPPTNSLPLPRIPHGLPQTLPQGPAGTFPHGLPETLPYTLPETFPYGLPKTFPYELPEAFPFGLPEALPRRGLRQPP